MNLQERLEMLKSNTLWKEPCGNEFYTVDKTDYDWIISTIEEQQKEIEGRKKFESGRVQQVNNLIEQNRHYREAIEKALSEIPQGYSDVIEKILLEALEGEE